MFCLSANKNRLFLGEWELLTSGSRNVYSCAFSFDDDWDGLARTAVFANGTVSRSVLLEDSGACTIPWEVLEKPGRLMAGVYGTRDGTVVLPTIFCELGTVHRGAAPAEAGAEPTPDVYDQLLAAAEAAEDLARSVREDADTGKFDGISVVGARITRI